MKHIRVCLWAARIIALITVFVALSACTNDGTTQNTSQTDVAPAKLELTVDKLAQYNGKNGNPAYIAVDGVIYDVSDVPQWKDGEHNGFFAGNDLSEEIKSISPHGTSKLKGLPAVGSIKP